MKTVKDACKLQPNALSIKLSDQIEQLDELITAEGGGTAFFEKTRQLRQNMFQKRLELAAELARQAPDAQKAGALQKEISGLGSQLAQKRLEFILQIKKINPGLGLGFMGGGFGMGHRGMMGSGCRMGPAGMGMGPGGPNKPFIGHGSHKKIDAENQRSNQ